MSNRHFGKYTGGGVSGGGEDIVILGHRATENDLLVCFLAAMTIEYAQQLRSIAMSDEAQRRDYLMPVLAGAHHRTGDNWQSFMIRAASRGGRTVRKITMKDVEFYDATQKAFFSGYGASIEPEEDARRKARNAAQTAILTGVPVAPPTEEQIQAAMAAQAPLQAVPAAPAAPAAPDPAMAMIAEALASLAAGQAALSAAVNNMQAPAPAAPRKKPGPKPGTKKAKAPRRMADPAPAPVVDVVAETTAPSTSEAES